MTESVSVPDLLPALPEIILALGAMALLLIGVFRGSASARSVSWGAVALMAVAFVVVAAGGDQRVLTFDGMFVSDGFSSFAKLLVLIGSALAILMSFEYLEAQGIDRPEFPVLVLLATAGMMVMVSANDLIALYLGLELQSLALYVVAAIRRDHMRSTEAGLKYFVLGALSSGMLLYGASLVYGFTGTTGFDGLAGLFGDRDAGEIPIGVIIGLVFLAAGLAFKISAVPFHMWAPDVYEGAPTPVTAFFAGAPKIAAIALFVRVLIEPFSAATEEWRQIIVFVSIASMLLAAFAAIGQTNIKRLMAYSSIGHMGYALVGLAAGTPEGVRAVIVYMAIYLAMNVGAFAVILAMRRGESWVEEIDELRGLAETRPAMALALAIFMFSLAGIPPLAGFFGKLYVFLAAINAGLYALAVLGVLASVVGAYYYLRIVKLMYFDEAGEGFDRRPGRQIRWIMAGAAVFTLFFFIYPEPLLAGAGAAAGALFP